MQDTNANETLYKIAITRIAKVGPITARNLISYCGSVEAVFKEQKRNLLKIPGVGPATVACILKPAKYLKEAQRILDQSEKNQIKVLFYLDPEFPKRLLNVPDCPLVLYYRGSADLNADRVVSIVGTRNPTNYGKQMVESLVDDLRPHDVLVLSGLAYGIDIAAHRRCVQQGMATVGILGSGIGKIYPQVHKQVTIEMEKNGGLLSEFEYAEGPDREHFPMRNRIIAGMSDATIVVESAERGGSIITAEIANGYHKDVFAIPGRTNDAQSAGCIDLIRRHKAQLIRNGQDIANFMRWEELRERKEVQRQIFVELDESEKLVAELIKDEKQVEIDQLMATSKLPMSELATVLLSLEFKGLIKSLPGKKYTYL